MKREESVSFVAADVIRQHSSQVASLLNLLVGKPKINLLDQKKHHSMLSIYSILKIHHSISSIYLTKIELNGPFNIVKLNLLDNIERCVEV